MFKIKKVLKNIGIIRDNDFKKAVRPLMKYLAENKHPHITAIVTGNTAELVEGLECYNTDEFIVD